MALSISTSAFSATLITSSLNDVKSLRIVPSLIAVDRNPNFPSRKLHSRASVIRPVRVAAPPTPPSTADSEKSAAVNSDEVEVEVDESGNESSSPPFSWRDNWYPVSLIEDLDPALPTPFQLLGRDIVLWFDKSRGEWVAFDDRCPHRLAPLSVSFLTCSSTFSIVKLFFSDKLGKIKECYALNFFGVCPSICFLPKEISETS